FLCLTSTRSGTAGCLTRVVQPSLPRAARSWPCLGNTARLREPVDYRNEISSHSRFFGRGWYPDTVTAGTARRPNGLLGLVYRAFGRTVVGRLGSLCMLIGLGLLAYSAGAYFGLFPGGYTVLPDPVALTGR